MIVLNWLFSRPLQLKFFVGTILFVVACVLVLVLNVSQVLNPFMTSYLERDMQERTHILAMTLMDGAAAHNPQDLQRLLQDISEMHGYCYLRVQSNAGKLLASAGSDVSKRTIISGLSLDRDLNGCFDGSIPLLHDGKPYGVLHYGVDISFVETLKNHLRNNFLFITTLWLVIGAAMYYLLVRRMVKPLQAITRASESMAHGNLNAAMPQNLPQDELGKLASSFSNMASSLRTRIESQHRYAHAVYAEQARLNALLTILPVGVMFVDPAHLVQYINLECRRLWGLSEGEEYIGRSDTVLIALANDELDQPEDFSQHVDAALKTYGDRKSVV
jgi:HAMP domain-containing protein